MVAGLKISPVYMGRPSTSFPTTSVVSRSAEKSPCKKPGRGLVLPKLGKVPWLKCRISRLVKKKVWCLRPSYTLGIATGPPTANPQFSLRSGALSAISSPRALRPW